MSTKTKGRKPQYLSKLREILRLLKKGQSYRDIYDKTGVCKSVVGEIYKKHLKTTEVRRKRGKTDKRTEESG